LECGEHRRFGFLLLSVAADSPKPSPEPRVSILPDWRGGRAAQFSAFFFGFLLPQMRTAEGNKGLPAPIARERKT
jgi:hypothetical protein